MNSDKMDFEEALAGDWQTVFSDDSTGDYRDISICAGEKAGGNRRR